ncbi:MAG: YbhB/YbcL family Raf kinase inhibitor-like protein [Myxococcota bacterium]
MKLTSDSIRDGAPIDAKYAFGKPDPEAHMTFADNRSPHLAWSDLPEGTKSLVLLCIDPDAPTRADDVNQEGRTVSKDLPRADFHHWVLVDISPDASPLREGEFSEGVTPKGKGPEVKQGPRGTRQGVNDYTGFLAGNPDLAGTYYGYDGPCPPWNDEIPHRYEFRLYALDVERCPVDGDFRAGDVKKAIEGHVLGQASITGTYSLNPDVKA